MLDNRSITGRYTGLFLLGCFLFSYPVLTIFNVSYDLFGIPLFFVYLFASWSVLIICILFTMKIPDTIQQPGAERTGNDEEKSDRVQDLRSD